MPAPTVVILAAGQGTRMVSDTPKVLHPVCGLAMIIWPVRAALKAGAERVIVVGSPGSGLENVLPAGVELAIQQEAKGTGDAVKAAAAHINRDSVVLILSGDVPLITSEAIAGLVAAHEASGAAATMVTMELDDPAGYGRVVRDSDGNVERVVETKADGDATAAELAIAEVNSGVFAFDGAPLLDALEHIKSDNAQGEYYLPDVLVVMRAAGHLVGAHLVEDWTLTLGVNDRVGLAAVTALAQQRIIEGHMRAGVTIVDPGSTLIEVDVKIGRDTVVEPSSFLRGATVIGERCKIGPLTTLVDCLLGSEVVVPHSYLVQATAHSGASIGPFAYLRPATVLESGAKAGAFVEIKNSHIGVGSKVPHLSYIGDADVGEQTNLGASTITANYDGRAKHRTKIGSGVQGGVHVSLVAPVTIGDGARTAAGSTITSDIPDRAMGFARARQENVEDYDARKQE
ncbi:MAG: bifunctional UDP-N-acetylglucosamine diphosphorylase/glucosamine-1-phosphate N-acetyltransferase GlmU [Actinomycetota bacterium]